MSYWRTDDKSIWSLSLKEWKPLFLFQGKHDDGQSENQRLPWSSERDANHVPTWQTIAKQRSIYEQFPRTSLKHRIASFTAFKLHGSAYSTYTVGIPWIWIGVGCTIPFFFKPFRIAASTKNWHLLAVVKHESALRASHWVRCIAVILPAVAWLCFPIFYLSILSTILATRP